jgi:hypothetical protein
MLLLRVGAMKIHSGLRVGRAAVAAAIIDQRLRRQQIYTIWSAYIISAALCAGARRRALTQKGRTRELLRARIATFMFSPACFAITISSTLHLQSKNAWLFGGKVQTDDISYFS